MIRRLKQIAIALAILFAFQGFGINMVLCFRADGQVAIESRGGLTCQAIDVQISDRPGNISPCIKGCTDIVLCDNAYRPDFTKTLHDTPPIIEARFITLDEQYGPTEPAYARDNVVLPPPLQIHRKTIVLLI